MIDCISIKICYEIPWTVSVMRLIRKCIFIRNINTCFYLVSLSLYQIFHIIFWRSWLNLTEWRHSFLSKLGRERKTWNKLWYLKPVLLHSTKNRLDTWGVESGRKTFIEEDFTTHHQIIEAIHVYMLLFAFVTNKINTWSSPKYSGKTINLEYLY